MPDRVVVRSPATMANLGPGFDCLGLALAWHNQVTVERHDGPLEITASGVGADGFARDASNLVARGLAAALGEEPRVRVHQMTAITPGRGFGSSAAAIVAGVVAGRALAGAVGTDEDALWLASEIEGHPDNVAPCLFGGITVVAGRRVERIEPPPDLRALVCVAPGAFGTHEARAALPDAIPRADAVAAIGRASLLVATLARGEVGADALMEATEDTVHQPSRLPLMPETASLIDALRARGLPAFLSGAGPSVGALVSAAGASGAEAAARDVAPDGWDVRTMAIEREGATVLEVR